MHRICRALGVESAAAGIFDLAKTLGLPQSLRALGFDAHDLDRASDLAMLSPYWNPRPYSRMEIRELLQHAYEGDRPS
jgi:maleylacetate reductase